MSKGNVAFVGIKQAVVDSNARLVLLVGAAQVAGLRWIAFVGIVFLGAGLRVFRLDYLGLWGDEAHTNAMARLDPPTILLASANGGYPPLYFLFIHYWQQVFGDSELALRLPSAIIGILLVGAAMAVGRDMFGFAASLLAGFLTAVTPLQLHFAQEARVYSLLALLILGATWCVWRAVNSGQIRFWLGYAGLMSVALYSHYSVVLILPAHALFCFFQRRAVSMPLPWFVAAVGFVFLLFIPWLPFSFHAVGASGVALHPQLAAYWSVLVSFMSDETNAGVGMRDILVGVVGLSLLILVTRTFLRQRNSPAMQVLICTLLVPLAIELPISGHWSLARHTSYVLPSFELLVAWAIVALGPGKLRILSCAAMLLVIAVALPRFYQGYRTTVISNQVSEDWRALAHELNKLDQRALILVAPRFYMMELDYYYTGRAPVQALPGQLDLTTVDFTGRPEISMAGLATFNDVLRQHNHLIVVGVLRSLVDPQQSIKTWLLAQGWHETETLPVSLAWACPPCGVEEFSR